MNEHPDQRTETGNGESVNALASQVLNMMMRQSRGTPGDLEDHLTYPDIIESLSESFLSDDPDMRRRAVAKLLGEGLSGKEFIASHAGDTARMLGDLWAENKISFAETTIGVARIQETVRSLAAHRRAHAVDGQGGEILLIAPEAEDHLLGLFVACEAFEALGCYVHLAIGRSADEIVDMVKRHRVDMIGVSISSKRTIKEAHGIIKHMRSRVSRLAPIVLGGGMTADKDGHRQLLEDTGADHVTCDPTKALEYCNIAVRPTTAVKA